MICMKCGEDLSHIRAEKYKTYEGIDEHHSPPEFMLEEWEGRIIRIMFEHSTLFKPNKSEHWTWIKVIPTNRPKCIKEVIKFTDDWIKNDSN